MLESTKRDRTPLAKGRMALLLVCAVLATAMLAGCARGAAQEEESSDPASLNRSYMARVNQRMADLGQVLEEFQVAVGEGDAVAMQASQAKAGRIIDEVKAAKAPSMLEDVKTGYADGLDQLQRALADYVQLYSDAQAGRLDEAAFNSRLAQVQEAYDAGVAALKKADETAVAVAQAPGQPSSSSGKAASSAAASSQAASSATGQDAAAAATAAGAATVAAATAATAQETNSSQPQDGAGQQQAAQSADASASAADGQDEPVQDEAPVEPVGDDGTQEAVDYQGGSDYVDEYDYTTEEYQEY